MKIYQPRLARLQVLALILPAQASHAFDPAAFDALAVMHHTSRASAVQRMGAPDTEICNTTVGDLLVFKSTKQLCCKKD